MILTTTVYKNTAIEVRPVVPDYIYAVEGLGDFDTLEDAHLAIDHTDGT
jgi:hypothetical protein